MQSELYDVFFSFELESITSLVQLKILFSDHNHITSTFYLIRTFKDLVSYEQMFFRQCFLEMDSRRHSFRK